MSRDYGGVECMVQCPSCLTLETVWIDNYSTLPTTRKFKQIGSRIFHDCGTKRPCKLFPRMKIRREQLNLFLERSMI